MALAQRSTELLRELPQGWTAAHLELTVDDAQQADLAAVILGPAAPGRRANTFRLDVYGGREPLGQRPDLLRRVLARLDDEGILGRLELVGTEEQAAEERAPARRVPLAVEWQRLLETLPPDWSHLYAEIDVDSSDYVERAALLLAPANPALLGGPMSFRFRCARKVGYGVSPEMARRCLERLDNERITGAVRVLRAVSDAHPVGTQGPVWYVGGRTV